MEPDNKLLKCGGPAFPLAAGDTVWVGMTVRDYFAAVTLSALIVATNRDPGLSVFAEDAYKMADAMLNEREKT